MRNFIGISREITDHWIYRDAEYFKTWFEMLCRARFASEPSTELIEGQLVTLERGYFIFGRKSWSQRIGISERRLRTLIDNLAKDNMIANVKKYSKFTVYKIVNYEKYNPIFDHQNDQQQTAEIEQPQESNVHQPDHQATNSRPPSDHQATTKEQRNKDNKDNKDNIIVLNSEEAQFIKILEGVKNYPLDRQKDLEMYNRLKERYPTLNLLESIKDWATYKLDQPLKANKCNPRSQINTSFQNYVKWGRNLKGGSDNGINKPTDGKSTKPPQYDKSKWLYKGGKY